MRPLHQMQKLFVHHYLGRSSGSALDAARRAGYKHPHPEGVRLLKNPAVQAAIKARVERAAMAESEVLNRLADVATSDMLDFLEFDQNGGCKLNLELVKRLGLGHLIKRLRINKDGTHDIVLESRLPALIKLGDYHKLWNREAEPQVTLVDLAKRMRERYEQLRKWTR